MTPFFFGSTTHRWMAWLGRGVSFGVLLLLLGACQQQPQPSVQSYLKGRVVVDSTSGSVENYSGFRVLVVRPKGRELDTLGYAQTDRGGHFGMEIRAPDRGIYPLTLWGRAGRKRLAGTDYVVAAGDSGTLHVELPLRRRPLRPASPENRAFRAYRNAMIMHQRMLTRQLKTDTRPPTARVQNIRLTSSTLWGLRDRYPGTYAAQFAAVQSLSFLEGWNDSLVVARARQIPSSSPHFLNAARIARRAEARRHGHRAALALVDSFQIQASKPKQQAGAKALRIQAFLDSLQFEAAYSAAQRLRAEHPHTSWAQWARRVRYEAKHLMPGRTAPNLTLRTLRGDTLSLHDLRGRPVVLEYYRPGTDLYNLQRPLRNALYEITRPDSVAFVSISVEPDSLVTRAYLHNQHLPGHKVIAAARQGNGMVSRYNVIHTPRWVLIDKDGIIVDQYWASDLPVLRNDLTRLLPNIGNPPASTSHPDSLFVPRILHGVGP